MSCLRITDGKSKGKVVKAPSGSRVRPTTSKVRQALFNILRDKVVHSRFLDLCAGSGVVGLEALSRGASALTAVEENSAACNILRKNIDSLGYRARVIRSNCVSVLSKFQANSFDLIYADPPYQTNLTFKIVDAVAQHHLLADTGYLIVEHYRKHKLPADPPGLSLCDTRCYGQTTLSFYARDRLAHSP